MNTIEAAFIAFVATDPELRTSAAGKPYLTIAAGVGEGEAVQWVRVACFGDRAVEVASQLAKGSRVYVEGRLTLNRWTAPDGAGRSGINVTAWRVEVLGQIGRQRPRRQRSAAPASTGHEAPFDDPLPDWGRP